MAANLNLGERRIISRLFYPEGEVSDTLTDWFLGEPHDLVFWPPEVASTWPTQAKSGSVWKSASNLSALYALSDSGPLTPTTEEQVLYFIKARCNHWHTVTGFMLSVGGTRYPFAVCNDSVHSELIVLWPPYYCGAGSGIIQQ